MDTLNGSCLDLSRFDIAIEISDLPCTGARIITRTWDQMQMQMSGTLSKGNGINPVAASDLTNQLGGLLHNSAPLPRFVRGKVHRTTKVAPGIQQTPTGQRSRTGMVS